MGYWGHGMYDGDQTVESQAVLLEKSGFKKNISLKTGQALGNFSEFEPGRHLLADTVVQKMFDNWEKISKKLPKIPKGGFTDEDDAIDHMMVADFFLNHRAQMPEGVRESGLMAAKYLIEGGHSDDFDNPAARKKVLRNFVNKLNQFEPTLIFSQKDTNPVRSIDEIMKEYKNHPDYEDTSTETAAFKKSVQFVLSKKPVMLEYIAEEIEENRVESIKSLREVLLNSDFSSIFNNKIPNLTEDSILSLNEVISRDVVNLYPKEINLLINAYKKVNEVEQEYKQVVSSVLKKK